MEEPKEQPDKIGERQTHLSGSQHDTAAALDGRHRREGPGRQDWSAVEAQSAEAGRRDIQLPRPRLRTARGLRASVQSEELGGAALPRQARCDADRSPTVQMCGMDAPRQKLDGPRSRAFRRPGATKVLQPQEFHELRKDRGFRRILRGTDRDSYYHERFLRGRPDLRPKMKRLNATQCKAPASGNAEDRHPDFNAPGRYVLLPDEPGNKRSAAMRAAGLVPGTEAVASSGSWNMHDEGNASQIQQPMGRSHTVSVSPGMNMPAQSNADYNYMSNFMVSSSNREFNYGRQMDNMTSASVGISDREANYHEMERFYSRSNCPQSQFTTGYNRHQSMPANLPPHSDHSQFNMARMPASTNTMPQYNRSSSNPVPRQMPVRHDPDSSSTDVDEQLGNIQRIMMDNEALAARIKELEGRIGPGCVREPSHGGMAARLQCSQEMTPQTRQVPDPPGDFSTGRAFEETARGQDPVSYRHPLNDSNVQVDCKQQKRMPTPTKSSDDDCSGDFEHSFNSNLNSFMSLGLSDSNLVPLPEMDAAEEAELGLGDVAEEAELKTRSSPTSSRDSPQADDNMESSVSLGMVDAMEGGGDSMTDVQWFQLQGT
ncbi:hypothetical protein THAOC_06239 [Thalassiosira oceanica]|uniref:HSF-type DNA-binding domain-containing protein n=1 Tax=Thalassiosira oceanica TaxID=159749 RepID=K0T567_THAOC|nr:hypothetical protein THAOC_06239 [Thalassiosira oceanica]|eukprot:EJK72244.1 hypothetical protein THAOC_06239 [Thalassiosira oceanica]